MNPWFYLTLLGDPLMWSAIAIAFAVAYLIASPFMSRGYKKKLRRLLLLLLPALFITLAVTYGLKYLTMVARPCVPCPAGAGIQSSVLTSEPLEFCNPYCEADYSFPSGHAAAIFAVFTSGLLAFSRKKKYLFLYIIPLLVSYSRLALAVHAPADVLSGALLGIAVPVLVWKIEKSLRS